VTKLIRTAHTAIQCYKSAGATVPCKTTHYCDLRYWVSWSAAGPLMEKAFQSDVPSMRNMVAPIM